MGYITEIGLTSRFFQGKGAYQLVYHKNSGTLPLNCLPIPQLGFNGKRVFQFPGIAGKIFAFTGILGIPGNFTLIRFSNIK